MLMKYKGFLDEDICIKKRELLLLLSVCTLIGMVIGFVFSPRKNVVIGSYNSADHYNDGYCGCDEE